MFVHNIDPVIFSIGPLSIRYYGVIYALGFILAYIFLKNASKRKELPIKDDDADALIIYLMIGVVVGARIFEILFYNPSYYFSNPSEMIALWHGGLSFHGGLAGGFIAVLMFCRKRRIELLQIADVIALPAALALAFGRIANFINGELYGTPSNLPWAVKFPGTDEFRHPSQLYESLKNFVIFFVLLIVRKPTLKKGYIFGLFLLLNGVMRFFIELVREPEMMIGPLTMGQILSIPTVIAGIWLMKRKDSVH